MNLLFEIRYQDGRCHWQGIRRNHTTNIVFEMSDRPWPWSSAARRSCVGAVLSRQSKYRR
jgi:hypothetical protein